MTKHIRCDVPTKAARALILIPHAEATSEVTRTHPLSETGVSLARRAKPGTTALIEGLTPHFGKCNVISGRDPKSLMTAFIGGPTSQFSTDPALDANSEAGLEKVAKEFAADLRDQPLTLAYATPAFINQMMTSKRPKIAACRDLRLGIEAAVVFMAGNGRIIDAQKLSLLAD